MEATKFINILKRHGFTLIAVPLFAIAIAYIFVRKLPDVYVSKATLSAGLADQSQLLLVDKADMQQEKTNQAFTNLIQMMQMRVIFDQLSYQLILHDLTSATPYRKPSKLMGYLNADARRHAIEVYTRLYNSHEPLLMSNPDQKGLNEVLVSMQYDYISLTKKMKIYRVENSDFITVEFESDSPLLSSVAVNTICTEFIAYYSTLTKENELKSVTFLNILLIAKKDSLTADMLRLENYKIQNRVLNLSEEAKSLYAQIADYESRLQIVQKDIQANTGALKSINNKFNDNDRQYMDSKLTNINQDILQSKLRLRDLNDRYIKSGFDSSYLSQINTLKDKLSEQINQSTDKYILNPLSAKEGLMAEKMKLEVSQDLAMNSIKSIQGMLNNLNKKFDQLVPNEAVIQAYESDISVMSQEYLNILNKYNETSLHYNSSVKVKLIESAGTGEKQPSKKLLLVAISGIVSFILCLLVLFILFYLDNSIKSPAELANKTNIPVLGNLPLLTRSQLELQQIWDEHAGTDVAEFKNLLRSARFEIDNALNGPSLINITSLSESEGKTLFATSLASAYLMTGKKVLLVDGNFDNNKITEIAKPQFFLEDYLKGQTPIPSSHVNELSIIGNRGGDRSLFELGNEQEIREKITALKSNFDIIIIESAALDQLNKSKEWIKAADKVVGIFEANKTLTNNEQQEVRYLQTIPEKYIGWIMNKLPLSTIPPKRNIMSRRKV